MATLENAGVLEHFPSREECVIADLLERQASTRGEETFVVFPAEAWTFAEAAQRAWELGAGLIRENVAPGEPVCVWSPTRPELIQSWFGINAAGAVYTPLNLAARGSFLEHALNLAGARVLIAHGGLVDRLEGLELPRLEVVVTIGETPATDLPWRVIDFADLLGPGGSGRPRLAHPTEPWDNFAIVYTSGTTGPSKGVQLSYASHRLYADSLVWPDIGPGDRFMISVPMSHVAGTSLTYAMLQRGGAVVLPGTFAAKSFWDEVRRHRATATFIIHGMVSFLLGEPAGENDAENPLRYVYMGPLTQVETFARRFGVRIYTGFGMTELPLALRSGLNPTSETTVGRPFNPDYECRLVDEHDLPVPDGTPGELIVRHRHPWVINSGYKDMPEATARAWRNGWFHTGDQLLVDPAGEWMYVDRTKDAIRRRGENISSYEVEAEVLSHDAVDQVAAIAVPNPDLEDSAGDQEVKVVIVPVAGRTIDPLELVEYLIPRMPRHMVPRFVEIVDELPRTPSFKIKKEELRAAGVTPGTWDRERAGVRLRRERLS
jgi:crotonobetaine/carnitine-CoA ligase